MREQVLPSADMDEDTLRREVLLHIQELLGHEKRLDTIQEVAVLEIRGMILKARTEATDALQDVTMERAELATVLGGIARTCEAVRNALADLELKQPEERSAVVTSFSAAKRRILFPQHPWKW